MSFILWFLYTFYCFKYFVENYVVCFEFLMPTPWVLYYESAIGSLICWLLSFLKKHCHMLVIFLAWFWVEFYPHSNRKWYNHIMASYALTKFARFIFFPPICTLHILIIFDWILLFSQLEGCLKSNGPWPQFQTGRKIPVGGSVLAKSNMYRCLWYTFAINFVNLHVIFHSLHCYTWFIACIVIRVLQLALLCVS